ncbi:MAG: RagB/SusD family nutrient uptake outer membrane protein [Bacteroidota bacterium]|nr:RagB/SusD family nutrient uptake outer membrane protein [Bacteroidota bacterium]
MKKLFIIVYILIFFFLSSCKKYLDIPAPDNQLIKQTVFSDNKTATSAMLSIYAQLEGESTLYNLTLYPGYSSDEFINYSTGQYNIDMATNNLTADNSLVLSLWSRLYKYIYEANSVMEGLANSPGISATIAKQLQGEALFVRAFCHFYLVNLFGKIPIALTTDYVTNSRAQRAAIPDVYSQIIADLQQAQNLLTDQYVSATNLPSTERVRPNKWAATALLARVFLYKGDYTNALNTSNSIIGQPTYSIVPNLNDVFLKGSSEAIWQILPEVANYNTVTGGSLILSSTPSNVSLSSQFIGQFLSGDGRALSWISSITVGGQTYYYAYKYKAKQNSPSISEYTIIIRLGEQYLIRSEARAQTGDLTGAVADLNVIRNRAGLSSLGLMAKEPTLDSIYTERSRELFAEYGHRWFDLIRSGKANTVLPSIKNGWAATDALYPIPQSEINRNPALTQNLGY